MPDKTVRDFVAAYLRPHRPRLVLLAVLFFAGIGLQLANPLLAKTFIDQASAGAPFDRLVRIAVRLPRRRPADPGRDRGRGLRRRGPRLAHHERAASRPDRPRPRPRRRVPRRPRRRASCWSGSTVTSPPSPGSSPGSSSMSSAARCSSSACSSCCGARTGGSVRLLTVFALATRRLPHPRRRLRRSSVAGVAGRQRRPQRLPRGAAVGAARHQGQRRRRRHDARPPRAAGGPVPRRPRRAAGGVAVLGRRQRRARRRHGGVAGDWRRGCSSPGRSPWAASTSCSATRGCCACRSSGCRGT